MIRLEAAFVIDGLGGSPFDGWVSIGDGVIDQVGRGASGTQSGEETIIRLEGLCILPGLIDAHSHIGMVAAASEPRPPLAVVAAQIFNNARTALDEGFTTLRDVGGLDGGLGRAIRSGLVSGPRILPSGPIISQSGGHADLRPLFDHEEASAGWPGLVQPSRPADGVPDVTRAARMALRDGATQLKVTVSGGFTSECDNLEDVQFGYDELRAAVDVAHSHHTYVTAHAHQSEGIRLGLKAGVECFEHGTFIDADTVREMQKHGASVVATLSIFEQYSDPLVCASLRPELQEKARDALGSMSRMVQLALESGVTVGLGSDMTGAVQRRRGREVVVRAAVTSPSEALVAATSGNAKVLRIAGHTGSLQRGMSADLIVVDGNPVLEPELIQDPERIRLVLSGGKVCKNTLPEPLHTDVREALDLSDQQS